MSQPSPVWIEPFCGNVWREVTSLLLYVNWPHALRVKCQVVIVLKREHRFQRNSKRSVTCVGLLQPANVTLLHPIYMLYKYKISNKQAFCLWSIHVTYLNVFNFIYCI